MISVLRGFTTNVPIEGLLWFHPSHQELSEVQLLASKAGHLLITGNEAGEMQVYGWWTQIF